MPPLPTRKSLEAMKRADLQRLCKDYGVKANLKTEALIDLLLDTQTPPAHQTRRSVSTRHSSRAGTSRISSVVIHDTDEENDEEDEKDGDPDPLVDAHEQKVQTEPELVVPPVTRTRRAKETQLRLGVGRPVAAGGAGPRSITKSLSVSKGKRAKSSRTMKPTEATIPEEEPEPPIEPPQGKDILPAPETELSDLNHNEPAHSQVSPVVTNPPANDSLTSLSEIDKLVADALRPLHDQMQSLKAALGQIQSFKSELGRLQSRVADVGSLQDKVQMLTEEVEGLRSQAATANALSAEFKLLKDNLTSRTSNTSTAQYRNPAVKKSSGPAGFGLPSSLKGSIDPMNFSGSNSSGPQTTHGDPDVYPGPTSTQSMLGKRNRDSTASHMTGIADDDDDFTEGEPGKKVIRPLKKRAKTAQDSEAPSQPRTPDEVEVEEPQASRVPSFTVFSGPDELPEDYLDPPPSTNLLPDFFAPPSPSPPGPGLSSRQTTTSTANASENQHPFNFSFLPTSSTSGRSMFMPSFPYPEAPQSPSPAGHQAGGPSIDQHQSERTDIFHSFGLPAPGRPRSRAAESYDSTEEFIDPAALTRRTSDRGKEREVLSNTVAVGLGLTAVRTASISEMETAPGSDAPPMKRTMYGTELDGDTRFGDFGVEGVATGFWAGGRF